MNSSNHVVTSNEVAPTERVTAPQEPTTVAANAPAANAPAANAPAANAPAANAPAANAPAQHTFAELGLEAALLRVLDKLKFVVPTPIQQSAIPVGIEGEDIIGIAQTGTGKTLAFGLPIINRFVKNGNRSRGRALIILPTRELALQVEDTFQKVGRGFGLKTAVLIGGAPMRPQQAALRANPDVIVATPGRLIDHLQQRGVDLRTVETLVLDEADRMLDMGFAPQIKQILANVPEERQTLLFSATMPEQIVSIANNYMRKPVRVEIARAGTMADNLSQELFIVPQEGKNEVLAKLLYDYTGTVLVFARTRSRASRVARFINSCDIRAAEIHSDRSLSQRRAALDGFKSGRYRVLVATDIAARGIDVNNIELVINYDIPDCADDYVHRIGRTGRAGKSGHAISFAAPDQAAEMRDIEKVIRQEVPVSQHSSHAFDVRDLHHGRKRRPTARGNGGRPRHGGSTPASTPHSRNFGMHANANTDNRGDSSRNDSRNDLRDNSQSDGRKDARAGNGAPGAHRSMNRGRVYRPGR